MDKRHAPDSLKYQWRVLGLVTRSKWATGIDKSIAFEIIDNYRKDHGNSRASLSYLVEATGADRKSVIASTRRLVENGPFSVGRAGAGTRPTEYTINFDLVQDKSSSGFYTTTTVTSSSGGVEPTTGGGVETTTSGSSSGADTTESVLPYAAYKADIQDRMIDPAPASPPLADGLKATAAGGAGGGFEELYRVYGNRQKKAEAKAAYLKLDPSPELHEHMMDAARVWFASWAAQGKADAPRFTLAKWIEREEFDCDPPGQYKAKERKKAGILKNEETPANDNEPNIGAPTSEEPDFTVYADEPALGVIERVEDWTDPADGGKSLSIFYRTQDGKEIEQFLMYESPDIAEQDRGQEHLRKVLEAVDLDEVNSADDLVGCKVDLMINGKVFVSCSKPFVPNTGGPRFTRDFKKVVETTPLGGWCSKIGTAYEDEDDEDVA